MNYYKQFFSKIGFSYFVYALLTIVFQILILNILGVINYGNLNDFNFVSIIMSICNYVLPLPILLLLFKQLKPMQIEKHTLNIKTFLLYVAITFTLLWMGNILGIAVTYMLETILHITIANPVDELINSQTLLMNILLVSIIGPIFEELIFRKILIDRTIKYGVTVSIIISAVLFAFMHGNLSQFFYALFMGGFFAYVYINTGNIIYSILLHIIINFSGSVITVFVNESTNAITQSAASPQDFILVILYYSLMFVFFLFGSYGLYRFLNYDLNKVEFPITTIFLNPGMLCYTGFCIILIIIQIF